jgi:hypothetical protein
MGIIADGFLKPVYYSTPFHNNLILRKAHLRGPVERANLQNYSFFVPASFPVVIKPGANQL